jgi:hypothetical protein
MRKRAHLALAGLVAQPVPQRGQDWFFGEYDGSRVCAIMTQSNATAGDSLTNPKKINPC